MIKTDIEKFHHVFSAGKYDQWDYSSSCIREVEITNDDLKKIADAYNIKFHEAPFWKGHPWDSGVEAEGWIAKLKAVGSKLYCSFSQIEETMIKAFQTGRYKRVSAELSTFMIDGVETLYFRALGATNMPLVKGLQPLEFSAYKKFEGTNAPKVIYASVPDNFIEEFNSLNQNNNQNNFSMDKLTEAGKLIAAKFSILIKNDSTDQSIADEVEKKFTDLKASHDTFVDAQANALVASAIADKKILEKDKETYLPLAKSNFSAVASMFSSMTVRPEFAGSQIPDKTIKVEDMNSMTGVPEDRKTWSYDDWQKKDPKGLAKLQKDHPKTFEALQDSFYGE